jgi:excisionase family DNA binding protein
MEASGPIPATRGRGVNAPLLTARAVADLLDVSTETVLRWSRCGSLPSFCLPGGAIRFRQDDLDAWLEGRRRPGEGLSATPRDVDMPRDGPAGRLAAVTGREAEEV